MDALVEKDELVELTAEIVSAYVTNNTVVATDLPALIQQCVRCVEQGSSSGAQPPRKNSGLRFRSRSP